MAKVVITFDGDATKLQDAFQLVEQAAADAEVQISKVKDSTGALTTQSDQAAKKVDKSTDSMERMKFAAQAAGGRVGEMAGRLENAARAASGLIGPIGSVGVALAAGAVAFTAIGLAGVAALVKITDAANSARREIQQLGSSGLGIDAGDADAIASAADAMEGVRLVAQALTAEIGAELAPTVEHAARVMVTLGMATVDAFNFMIEGSNKGGEALRLMIDLALNPGTLAVAKLSEAFLALSDSMGVDLNPNLRAVVQGLSESTITARTAAGTTALLNGVLGDYGGRVDALFESIRKKREEEERDTAAIERKARALEQIIDIEDAASAAVLSPMARIAKERDDQIRRIQQLRDEAGDSAEARIAAEFAVEAVTIEAAQRMQEAQKAYYDEINKLAAERRAREESAEAEAKRLSDQRKQKMMSDFNAIAGAATSLGAAIVAAFDAFGKKSEETGELTTKAARKAFIASKAFGIADAVIKTAQGIAYGLTLGPVAGPIYAGLAAATGGIQIATIAAQQFDGGASARPSAGGFGGGGGGGEPGAIAALSGQSGGITKFGADPDNLMRRGATSYGGAMYRHRDLDVVGRDSNYPGGAFYGGSSSGQSRYERG